MRTSPMLFLSLSALSVTSPTWAAFTGVTSQYAGTINGRHVWRVYAVSNNANDMLFAAFGHHVLSGDMNAVQHNDSVGGSWAPHANGGATNDSFVTITGNLGVGAIGGSVGTVLTSGWTNGGMGNVIENTSSGSGGASWQISDANLAVRADSGILVDGSYRVMIMQIAGSDLALNGNIGFNARINLAWWQGGSTTPEYLFNGSYSVPAPGVVMLAALSNFCAPSRRRRNSR